ncbi:MAG: desulfoferrodoxin family protein [Candidatus Gracilibacteria bacterium]|jgi:superoxide reductase|nr:desulfoferrodoxin family protein [Candidatus Gracilibacteria bacterium]
MKKYRCSVCGYVHNPKKEGVSFEELPEDYVCPTCGVPKNHFEEIHHKGEEQTGGEAQEKHAPVIHDKGKDIKVIVGSVPHPMTEAHHIEWIELQEGDKIIKKVSLQHDAEPVAIFENIEFSPNLKAYAGCNLHGIWESEDM